MKTFERIVQSIYGTKDEVDYICKRLTSDEIQEAAEEYAEQFKQRGWLPIDSAPKDGTTVLLYSNKNGLGWDVVGYGRYEKLGIIEGWISGGFSETPGNLGLAHPTHWMPLPTPPKNEIT